jgi:hypothetical protein
MCAPRQVEKTLDEVKHQINLASMGKITAVKESQTTNGVKDKIAQHWVVLLLAKAKELQAQEKQKTRNRRSDEDISKELLAWLAVQCPEAHNPLLTMTGVYISRAALFHSHLYLLG